MLPLSVPVPVEAKRDRKRRFVARLVVRGTAHVDLVSPQISTASSRIFHLQRKRRLKKEQKNKTKSDERSDDANNKPLPAEVALCP